MKKLVFLGILQAFIQAWGINIAFIDSQMAFDSHPDSKKAREILKNEIERGNLEIRIREKEIIKLQEELKKPLSEEAKRRKEATIQAKIEELQNYQQEAAEALANKRKELEDEINLKIKKVIKDIAKNKKIDLVIDKDVIVYGENFLDITDEVVKEIKEVEKEKKK